MGQTYLAEPDADRDEASAAALQAGQSPTGLLSARAPGQKVLTFRGAMPRGPASQPLCADIDGLSPPCAVRWEAHDCRLLEQLCRYISCPALSGERVQLNAGASGYSGAAGRYSVADDAAAGIAPNGQALGRKSSEFNRATSQQPTRGTPSVAGDASAGHQLDDKFLWVQRS